VHSTAFHFALLAGLSMATYTVFLRLASGGIHPALGATIVTGVAFVVNLSLTLTMKAAGVPIAFTSKSMYFIVVVGVAAACADFFTLSAYAQGLKITSSFIIGGTSTALVLLVGFLLLKEPFTWVKLLAVGLIVAGVFLLQRQGL
jgi:uncharacterized membrane protein